MVHGKRITEDISCPDFIKSVGSKYSAQTEYVIDMIRILLPFNDFYWMIVIFVQE